MSTRGVSFKYGSTRLDTDTEEEAEAQTRPPLDLKAHVALVDWKVGDASWKETSPNVQAMGISRYMFFVNSAGFAQLDFTNTNGRHFAFVGQEQESFNVYVTFRGDHFVRIGDVNTVITSIVTDWENNFNTEASGPEESRWTLGVSKNGMAFKYRPEAREPPPGVTVTSQHSPSIQTVQTPGPLATVAPIWWTVRDNDDWVPLPDDEPMARSFGLSYYALCQTAPISFGLFYNMWIWNDFGWGFVFKDRTGDEYSLATIRNGSHKLKYFSVNPTMVGVKQFQ